MKRPIFLLLLFSLTTPALGAPAISCHCFQDRSFNPERPRAVDPYLLANAQNSLLAAVYDLPKGDLVRAKMGGADGDRLWVTHHVSHAGGVSPGRVAAALERTGNWGAALFLLEIDPALLGDAAADLIGRGAGEGEIARALVDRHLEERLGVAAGEVEALRRLGADNRQAALASLLSRIGGPRPSAIYQSVRGGQRGWGEWSDELGLEPTSLEQRLLHLLAAGAQER